MTCIFVPESTNLIETIPSALTQLKLCDLSMLCNSSQYYVQGKIEKFRHFAAKRKILKLEVKEEGGSTSATVLVCDDVIEQCKNVDIGDTVAITSFDVEYDDLVSAGHSCFKIIVKQLSSATIWVKKQQQKSDLQHSGKLANTAVLSDANDQWQLSLPKTLVSKPVELASKASEQVAITGRKSLIPISSAKMTSKNSGINQSQSAASTFGHTEAAGISPQSICAKKGYQYEVLANINANIKDNTVINVIGVVKYCRPVTKTRGTDYSMMVSIVDDSVQIDNHKLKCVLFAKHASALPDVETGQIVCFHRLKIVTYDGNKQGQISPGFSWLVFDPVAADTAIQSIKPKKSSSANFTFSDGDKAVVLRLSKWSNSNESLLSQCINPLSAHPGRLITISSLAFDIYFDLVCQVVGTCVIVDKQSILMRVWDGTKPALPLYEQQLSVDDLSHRFICDKDLCHRARGYIAEVWVYDNHFAKAKAVKPGDFVKLTNVHALAHKFTENDHGIDRRRPLIELCVHGKGSKYGRDVTILDAKVDPAVQSLKSVLAECVDDCNPDEFFSPLDSPERRNGKTQKETDSFVPIESNGYEQMCYVANATTDTDEHVELIMANKSSRKRSPTDVLTVSDDDEPNEMPTDSVQVTNAGDISMDSSSFVSVESDSLEERYYLPCVDNYDAVDDIVPTQKDRKRSPTDDDERNKMPANAAQIPCGESSRECVVSNKSAERCIQNTATVIIGHHHIKTSRLRDVVAHDVPYKFRVSARVVGYAPKPVKPTDIIQLFCTRCNFLSHIPSASLDGSAKSSMVVDHEDEHITYYRCPNCHTGSDPVILAYIFAISLVIDDGTGWLSVLLCGEEAVRFFHDTTATDVLKSPMKFNEIQHQLASLCSDDNVSTTVECCIMSYGTPCGKTYKIFDTELSIDIR